MVCNIEIWTAKTGIAKESCKKKGIVMKANKMEFEDPMCSNPDLPETIWSPENKAASKSTSQVHKVIPWSVNSNSVRRMQLTIMLSDCIKQTILLTCVLFRRAPLIGDLRNTNHHKSDVGEWIQPRLRFVSFLRVVWLESGIRTPQAKTDLFPFPIFPAGLPCVSAEVFPLPFVDWGEIEEGSMSYF